MTKSGSESDSRHSSPDITNVRKRKVIYRSSEKNNGDGSNRKYILNQTSLLKKTKMNEMRKKRRNVFKRINYSHFFIVLVMPFIALFYISLYADSILPKNTSTLVFTFAYYNLTMLSFSIGYHKYFCHNSFFIKFKFLATFLAIMGSSVGLGPIRTWAALHRAHHQFTDDTEKDPYSIKRGIFWTHWGWILQRPKSVKFNESFIESEFPKDMTTKPKVLKDSFIASEIEIEDQELSAVSDFQIQGLVQWQESYYFAFFILTSILVPMLSTHYFLHDSMLNGLLYPGIIRMFFCQQSLLSIESFGHTRLPVAIPNQPFSEKNTSKNCSNPLFSIFTYGQASQNFHHQFPHDYRSDPSLFAFDPTKWFINVLSFIGLVDDLCKTPDSLITQIKIQRQQYILNRLKNSLNWGTPISKLPSISSAEFKKLANSANHRDKIYLIIQNIIHDITPFINQHPGGPQLIRASNMKDATKAFYGGVYSHSTAAINLLATMRIAVLYNEGSEEEVWRRVAREERESDNGDLDRNEDSYRSAEAA